MSTVTLSGKTYGIRDMLKAKGGKYNAASKTWTVDADAWERIRKMDCGRYAYGVFALAPRASSAARDWQTDPQYGYAE